MRELPFGGGANVGGGFGDGFFRPDQYDQIAVGRLGIPGSERGLPFVLQTTEGDPHVVLAAEFAEGTVG